MKFKTSSSAFLSQMRIAKNMLDRKNVLAILNYALVAKFGDEFRLVCARPESRSSVKLDFEEVETEDFTPFCIDIAYLSNVISTIPDQPIELAVDPSAGYATEVKHSKGFFKMQSLPATDFPEKKPIADAELVCELRLPSSVAIAALTAASTCTSVNYAMQMCETVLLDVTSEGVAFVGTDTVRLFVQKYVSEEALQSSGCAGRIVLHKSLIPALTSALNGSENVTIRFDGKSVDFSAEKTLVSLSVSPITYPDYRRIIPVACAHHLKAEQSVLDSALAQASTTSRTVVLHHDADETYLSALDPASMKDCRSVFHCSECTLPEGFQVALDAFKFQSLLKNIRSEEVVICVDSASRPALIKPALDDDSLVQLLMPLTLQTR